MGEGVAPWIDRSGGTLGNGQGCVVQSGGESGRRRSRWEAGWADGELRVPSMSGGPGAA